MTSDDIRREVLFQHYALRQVPLAAAQIERECRKQQMPISRSDIADAQQFLADDGLLVAVNAPGTAAKLWRITANGQRHYEQTYAA